ncbi:MAG: acyl transferase [Chitinophagaceae bacterium]|nr:acyl transferase [Chitinophagaceae bacterium]
MLQPPLDTNKLWELAPDQFWQTSKLIFNWQAAHNPVYKQWVELNKSSAIAFLPIYFFKTQDVFIGEKPVNLFESSGTTQDVKSNHWVQDLSLYEASFLKGFELFYGNPADYCIIGLLPSYLERKHSSLVYMVDKLIQASGHAQSGFYLDDFTKLNEVLQDLEKQKQKVWFIGVSFALTDFAIAYPQQLNSTIVLETGGMKGRKEELTRNELHQLLREHLGTITIHSEYGMTELLSQAYAIKEGVFKCPPWMKVMVAEEEDPTAIKEIGRGVLHIIDLANIYSCSFIATEDVGEVFEDGSFTVLGRLDASARRGCSLLVV